MSATPFHTLSIVGGQSASEPDVGPSIAELIHAENALTVALAERDVQAGELLEIAKYIYCTSRDYTDAQAERVHMEYVTTWQVAVSPVFEVRVFDSMLPEEEQGRTISYMQRQLDNPAKAIRAERESTRKERTQMLIRLRDEVLDELAEIEAALGNTPTA